MKTFYTKIVSHKILILTCFLAAFCLSLLLRNLVSVNYDLNDYLPADTHSTLSLQKMQTEFDGVLPNARIMLHDVSIPEALDYKEKIAAVDGVAQVLWLDDAADVSLPLSSMDSTALENYYKNGSALLSVAIRNDARIPAVTAIREIIGEDNAMTGAAVSTAAATESTLAEIRLIAVISVLFVLLILILTTHSWMEPLLILAGIGVAVVINSGSNLIFGEISFVTNAAGSILQLAVSLDYSVFLIHRFEECRKDIADPKEAMVDALCKSTGSILSSGLTTVIGFLALVLMRFRLGPDLGLALAKGIVISLITVFLFMPAFILCVCPLIDRTRHRAFLPPFHRFGRFIRRISVPLIFVFVLVIAPAFLASNANAFTYGAAKIFGTDTQIGADTAEIDEIFGESDSYVLLVPAGDTATQKQLSDALQALPHVKSILSFVDAAGPEVPPSYLDADTLAQLESAHYSRMVLSVDLPYEGEETFSLIQQIRDTAKDFYSDDYYLAGQGVSTYDLKNTVTSDMLKVNLLAVAAVFLVLVLTLRSLFLPVILVLSIETAIWLNLSIPYFMNQEIFYLAYLIISSIQLGATVDYAILLTNRYRENRQTYDKPQAVVHTVSDVTVSILTSGLALTVVGLLLGYFSSNQLIAQLGLFIGRGAVFSMGIVLFVLPGLLSVFDRLVIRKKKKLPAAGH